MHGRLLTSPSLVVHLLLRIRGVVWSIHQQEEATMRNCTRMLIDQLRFASYLNGLNNFDPPNDISNRAEHLSKVREDSSAAINVPRLK